MKVTGRTTIAVACVCYHGLLAAFTQQPPNHSAQQLRQVFRHRGAVRRLAVSLPANLNKLLRYPEKAEPLLPSQGGTNLRRQSSAFDRDSSCEMSSTGDDRHWGSAKRNRSFISAELSRWLASEDDGESSGGSSGAKHMLEIASGTGCHVEAYAKGLPDWTFKPTEYDETRIPDIVATIKEGGYTNILPPTPLDVCADPATWPQPEGGGGGLWDAMICVNMIHIAPKECTTGLLKGAAVKLKIGGRLFVYGPFMLNGLLIPESNKSFDESLKARSDGSWGIRDVVWVTTLADAEGLELVAMTAMPANNFFVVFRKVREAASAGNTGSDEIRASRVAERVAAVVEPAKEVLIASLV